MIAMWDLFDEEERLYTAFQPHVAIGTLEHLAEDPACRVRLAVALNHRTPIDVLAMLSRDRVSYVATIAQGTLDSRMLLL